MEILLTSIDMFFLGKYHIYDILCMHKTIPTVRHGEVAFETVAHVAAWKNSTNVSSIVDGQASQLGHLLPTKILRWIALILYIIDQPSQKGIR